MDRIITEFWAKPIPPRQFDWSATYEDYDGAGDSSTRGHIGYGATEADAVLDLIDNHPRGIDCTRDLSTCVNVIEDDSGETILANVPLAECFPEPDDDLLHVLRKLERGTFAMIGGGAAPLLRIERVSA